MAETSPVRRSPGRPRKDDPKTPEATSDKAVTSDYRKVVTDDDPNVGVSVHDILPHLGKDAASTVTHVSLEGTVYEVEDGIITKKAS